MRQQRHFPLYLLMVLLSCTSILFAHNPQNDSLQPKKNELSHTLRPDEMQQPGRMRSSAYPVQMIVRGRSVSIVSKHEQTLPIYTQMGTFYMALHLSKGTNWLSGLPRGSYFINRQLVTVN